ncbi:hypothetical protein [Saliphagus infecundisoli]|uniref:Uncharacterized protein n=1 Tax=Saliphagus infecundisoli TaxID=1849069 RepID=A0ABD5QGH2_9EURY|nr:hypothetical protein [Saliphagus infecundisoli]
MSRNTRFLALLAVVTGTTFIVLGLAVPTGAIVSGAPDEGRSRAVALEPTSDHAGLSGDELVVELASVNRDATSRFDSVFTITAREAGAIRLETDVEGVAFHRDGQAIAPEEPLRLEAGETVPVGVIVETADADPEGGTFTVYVEGESTAPTYAVGSRIFTDRLTALVAVPIAVGLLSVAGLVRRRRDLWPVLP